MSKPLGLAFLLLQLLGSPAFAAMLPSTGQLVSGQFDLLDKPIPLPPGEWVVASAGLGHVADQDPGPYGAIGGVLLVRPDGNRTHEFLIIHTNSLPLRTGWGEPPECAAHSVLFRSVGEPRNQHNACTFVVARRRGQILRSGLPALGGSDAAAGLSAELPPWALITGFRVSDRRDVLDIRYGIAPQEPDPAGWFTPELDRTHSAVVAELAEWAQAGRQSAFAALRGPIDQVPPMPALTPIAVATTTESPEEQISALRLGLYKLATYRAPATLFTLAVSSIAAGDLYIGGIITFWQSLTHSGVYLGNELAWEWPNPTPTAPFVATQVVDRIGGASRDDQPTELRHAALPAADTPVLLAASSTQLPATILAAQRMFAVDGKQVPLPVGRWQVLASGTAAGVTGTILGNIEGGALRGLVMIHSNPTKATTILGPSSDCERHDVWFSVTRYDTPEDGFCSYGKSVVPTRVGERAMQATPLWDNAARRLAEDGIAVPPDLMMVGIRVRTQENFLDTRYYFATPAGFGGHGIAAAPDELLPALRDWTDLLQEPLELGVRGRLRRSGPMPWPLEPSVQAAMAAQTHDPLERLAVAGAIGPADLQRQIAEVDAMSADREQQRLSLWSRSFLKVATYRIASYVDTFAVQTFFTASAAQGVVVASIHAVAKPIMAYANELYWAHSGVGKAPATLLAADFPEIGSDR